MKIPDYLKPYAEPTDSAMERSAWKQGRNDSRAVVLMLFASDAKVLADHHRAEGRANQGAYWAGVYFERHQTVAAVAQVTADREAKGAST